MTEQEQPPFENIPCAICGSPSEYRGIMTISYEDSWAYKCTKCGFLVNIYAKETRVGAEE